MTHTGPMPDSAGDFGEAKPTGVPCPECKAIAVTMRSWDSSCGGWTDHQYRCAGCGHTWWVDGIDS